MKFGKIGKLLLVTVAAVALLVSTCGTTNSIFAAGSSIKYDNTKKINKGGIYVNLNYGEYGRNSYVPQFTFQLATMDNKVLDTVVAGRGNYDAERLQYNLHFKHASGFKKGDRYKLYLASTDGIAKTIEIWDNNFDNNSYSRETTTLQVKNYYVLDVKPVEVEGDNGIINRAVLKGSKDYPLSGGVFTDTSKVGIKLADGKGKALKNVSIQIDPPADSDGKQIIAKSGADGMVWIKTDQLRLNASLKAEGYSINKELVPFKLDYVVIGALLEGEATQFVNFTLVLRAI